MNGEVIRTYAGTGLSVKMLVPLTHERWPRPRWPATTRRGSRRRTRISRRPCRAGRKRRRLRCTATLSTRTPAWTIRSAALPQGRTPFEQIALLLQGGGALGSYQAGVYEALAEADLHPDWVAGISIGAINSAIIAGNPPEKRVDALARVLGNREHVAAGHSLFQTCRTEGPNESSVRQSGARHGTSCCSARRNFFVPRMPPALLWPPRQRRQGELL